jgi:hypothetical protein
MTEATRLIRQDVSDISSADELIRFAAAGQLAQLLRHRRDLSHAKVAYGAGLGQVPKDAGSVLSTALKHGFTAPQLVKLDEVIGALTADLSHTGGLCSLAMRLSGEGRDEIKGSMTAHVPPSWTRRILKEPPHDEHGVLIQASALLSAFQAADRVDPAGRSIGDVRERYRAELEPLMRRLILISVGPPTSRNVDAQVLLGSLASYAFEPMKQRLEHELRFNPLGFRVWPAITKLVKLSPPDGEYTAALRSWVKQLIRDSEDLRKTSLYAGRSLDLELAIVIPGAWSPPGADWAGTALLTRARNGEATLRERGTAALGLWQRAVREQRPDIAGTEADLRQLIAEFREPGTRPDIASGLRWVAATLEDLITRRVAVCNEWPDIDEPWFQHVTSAANDLDDSEIPEHLRAGAKNLLQHMILQNAGVYRRQAIETVVTSGWNEPVANCLGRLLRSEQQEAWVRIRALFALGFLQSPSYSVEADLTSACQHAYRKLNTAAGKPVRADITEMHTALFAVGDCFGVPGAEERALTARDALSDVLVGLAEAEEPQALMLRRAARAVAYLLTVTAQPQRGGVKDLSQELLERFSCHPDSVTAQLAKWALSCRFADDGSVRPMLAAIEY